MSQIGSCPTGPYGNKYCPTGRICWWTTNDGTTNSAQESTRKNYLFQSHVKHLGDINALLKFIFSALKGQVQNKSDASFHIQVCGGSLFNIA